MENYGAAKLRPRDTPLEAGTIATTEDIHL